MSSVVMMFKGFLSLSVEYLPVAGNGFKNVTKSEFTKTFVLFKIVDVVQKLL